jgi:hypothetical protein
MRSLQFVLLVLLVGCGHTLRGGAGPLVDNHGNAGAVASFEVGTHLIGGRRASMPIGVRTELSATRDGVQGLVGIAYGATLPPGGRAVKQTETVKSGWGGRLAYAAGAVVDGANVDFGMRGGLALTRGWIQRGGSKRGGCFGSHEKSSWCYAWEGWKFAHTGVEIGTALRFVQEADGQGLDVTGWRLTAEVVHERGTFSDLVP